MTRKKPKASGKHPGDKKGGQENGKQDRRRSKRDFFAALAGSILAATARLALRQTAVEAAETIEAIFSDDELDVQKIGEKEQIVRIDGGSEKSAETVKGK
jgi:hypothetical protein